MPAAPRRPATRFWFTLPCWALLLIAAGCGGSGGPGPTPVPAAPSITCPAAREISTLVREEPAVAYELPSTSGGQAPVAVACTPSTGARFPFGTTSVNCTATDSLARVASCAFVITVRQAPQLAATRYLAFGDSLTAGTTSPDPVTLLLNEPDSYPFKLQNLLRTRYPLQDIEVLNEGCGGEFVDRGSQNCEGGVRRLPGLLRQYTPQAVLLMHGANNLLNFEDDGIPDLVRGLETMIGQVQSSGATVMLATLPPQDIRGSRGQGADELPILNSQIASLAQRKGAVLVDLFGLLGGNPAGLIGVDGLHPTRHGYDVIAELWRDAVQGRFERLPNAALRLDTHLFSRPLRQTPGASSARRVGRLR